MSQTPRLPVPDLAETCERYLKQVRPLLSDEAYEKTAATTRYFKSRKGKELQAALQQFADEAETSWLIDAWLESYLRIRTPLPLASNVGFAIKTQGKDLAEWASALAAVCADYYHQRIPVPETPQGTPVCMAQWAILQGASRIPQKDVDGYHFSPKGSRHIGVIHNGFYYRIAALDEQFEAYHPETFRQAFEHILADTVQNSYPIAVPCYLGGNEAARVYQILHQQEDNACLLEHIEEDLFHISISNEDLDADSDLARTTFQPQQNVWCYKPTTYCYNTATKRLFLHCEHTWEDGGALKGIVTLAAGKLASPGGKKTHPAIHRYEWQLDAALQKNWPKWQQNYAKQANQMRVASTVVPFNGLRIPKGISQDALMQFLLQYAQLTTYGCIRNTYEAVDVSHFQSGRTECVRPVSEESLAFVSTLLQDNPSQEALNAALVEHKARIKASKLGLGANRHLLGLQLMVPKVCGRNPVFFKDEGYQTFTTDFLSTSTVGDDSIVVNFAFAPTSRGGLGINYTVTPEGWLFTISHTENQQQEVGVFLEALKLGGRHLLEFLNA
ncbi:choline/carnitine O-acyltransferase [Neisseria sp. 83E34]|uniref:choline/carnitine O-acyltransferase n=1 Tax=Neisseria sp. 83E34 TaxID=1692264 RepID=UPI0006CE8EAD|nr:choline/carnitine O-acyltransferase [Neisseria sp. 83E34]KPN70938.1 carnitine acyltransferase [Neisseria sp. 83E34]